MYTISRRIFIRTFPFTSTVAKILGRDVYAKLYGRNVYYDPNTDVGQKLLRVGNFERAELAIIEKFLTETSVVFDIGANIGTHSLFMATETPKGKVFSFEPSRGTYRFLLKNTAGISNISPVNMAASNYSGEAVFYNATDNAYSGLKETGKRPITATETVLTIRIDDFAKIYDIKKLDFIKIDVEGSDDEVLEGALETISRHKPVILAEIYGEKRSNPDPEKTIKRMRDIGYDVYMVKGWEIVPFTKHDNDNYNYVFVPRGMKIPK